MRIAKGMLTIIFKIWFPVVMTQNPFEYGKNPYFIYGIAASFLMGEKISPLGIGCAVQPRPETVYIDTSLSFIILYADL